MEKSPKYTLNSILRFFEYDHLPPLMAEVSQPFYQLSRQIDRMVPDGPEKTVALRKLLESKDAAVRAVLV